MSHKRYLLDQQRELTAQLAAIGTTDQPSAEFIRGRLHQIASDLAHLAERSVKERS